MSKLERKPLNMNGPLPTSSTLVRSPLPSHIEDTRMEGYSPLITRGGAVRQRGERSRQRAAVSPRPRGMGMADADTVAEAADADLVRAIARGDKRAFEQLFRQHGERIFPLCRAADQ